MTDSSPIDARRQSQSKASIRLTWAHAGHETSTLQMHAALRILRVPRELRPRNVADFRTWRDVEKEKIEARENPPFIYEISLADWNAAV